MHGRTGGGSPEPKAGKEAGTIEATRFGNGKRRMRNPIRKPEIIGRHIKFVFEVDLPFDVERQFQPRIIVLELDSGLRFALQQETQIQADAPNVRLLFPYEHPLDLRPTLSADLEQKLASPINCVFVPYGWKDQCGVMLENGVVLHDGYSDWDNGIVYYDSRTLAKTSLRRFELPDAET
jgi:hypothetical protein